MFIEISRNVFQNVEDYQISDSEKEEAQKLLVDIQNLEDLLKELNTDKANDPAYQKALANAVIQLENLYQSDLTLGSIPKYQLEELFSPIENIVMNGMIDSKSPNFLGASKNAYYFNKNADMAHWLQSFVSTDQGLYKTFLSALEQGLSNFQQFINS